MKKTSIVAAESKHENELIVEPAFDDVTLIPMSTEDLTSQWYVNNQDYTFDSFSYNQFHNYHCFIIYGANIVVCGPTTVGNRCGIGNTYCRGICKSDENVFGFGLKYFGRSGDGSYPAVLKLTDFKTFSGVDNGGTLNYDGVKQTLHSSNYSIGHFHSVSNSGNISTITIGGGDGDNGHRHVNGRYNAFQSIYINENKATKASEFAYVLFPAPLSPANLMTRFGIRDEIILGINTASKEFEIYGANFKTLVCKMDVSMCGTFKMVKKIVEIYEEFLFCEKRRVDPTFEIAKWRKQQAELCKALYNDLCILKVKIRNYESAYMEEQLSLPHSNVKDPKVEVAAVDAGSKNLNKDLNKDVTAEEVILKVSENASEHVGKGDNHDSLNQHNIGDNHSNKDYGRGNSGQLGDNHSNKDYGHGNSGQLGDNSSRDNNSNNDRNTRDNNYGPQRGTRLSDGLSKSRDAPYKK